MSFAEAVTYSGPTYVAIRSGIHSSSTASTHLSYLRNLEEILKDEEGRLKPVVLIISDGGPEENPRYPKVISHAIHNFVLHNLDAIFIFTNAPGRSAFNRVERRMAPLSRELFGWTHTSKKRTFRRLVKFSQKYGEIWLLTAMALYVAEYIEPDDSAESFIPDLPSQQWYCEHVRESQYLLHQTWMVDEHCCFLKDSCNHKPQTDPKLTESGTNSVAVTPKKTTELFFDSLGSIEQEDKNKLKKKILGRNVLSEFFKLNYRKSTTTIIINNYKISKNYDVSTNVSFVNLKKERGLQTQVLYLNGDSSHLLCTMVKILNKRFSFFFSTIRERRTLKKIVKITDYIKI
ncbi:hypothetical protein ABMA27_007804 [Loxostege sticticalis]|uniref:VWFA domain-containing protein n=1 Tax=Loxostege sticticalis TaxID=481309 RepID=A0ABR3HD27_LOXSC